MTEKPQLALPFETVASSPTPDDQIRFVRHQRARRYLIRVDRDGQVRVTIPRGGSRREAEAFARRSQAWVARQRASVAARMLPPEDEAQLKGLARVMLPERLLALAAIHGLTVSRVSIRNPKGRWGSCSRNGSISLNWRLVRMPDWVRDYVLIHELMHLKQMNHSPAFWALVAAAYPRFEEARAWLRANGAQIG